MTSSEAFPLVAVDVGNSRIKFGLFTSRAAAPLPAPIGTLDLEPDAARFAEIAEWLAPHDVASLSWWIGSVQRNVASLLIDWLREAGVARITLLTSGDLPLQVAVPRPDMVGIDRLLDAVAANQLRQPGRPVVVVDLGTAITVDLISADGVFLGGAILPGIGTSARALHEFTDLLPLLAMHELRELPPALGTGTCEALRSGLFWGTIGAVRELIDRLGQTAGQTPQVVLTGGAAPAVAGLLQTSAEYMQNLTLAGIALSAK